MNKMKFHFLLLSLLFSIGAFAQPQFLPSTFSMERPVNYINQGAKVCDLDNDGDLDIIQANVDYYDNPELTGGFVWFENVDGDYFEKRNIDIGFNYALKINYSDLDADGDIDIIASRGGDDELMWYENNGSAEFTKNTIDFVESEDIQPVDFDQDGDIDLMVRNSTSGEDEIVWYKNNGSQQFTAVLIDEVTNSSALECIDLNDDGFLDLVISTKGSSVLSWYKNDGFSNLYKSHILGSNFAIHGIDVVDIDQDGDMDILAAMYDDDELGWYINDGNEEFTYSLVDFYGFNQYTIFDIHTADMNSDGHLDILASTNYGLVGYKNNGDEQFTGKMITSEIFRRQSWHGFYMAPLDFEILDFDGDGRTDIIGGSSIYLNRSNDQFIQKLYNEKALNAWDFHLIDFNQDGKQDLLSFVNKEIWMTEFHENNLKSSKKLLKINGGVSFWKEMDFDNDGHLDIVYVENKSIKWAENRLNGLFEYKNINVNSSAEVEDPYLVDYDNDGDMDIIFRGWRFNGGDGVHGYINDGDLNFTYERIAYGYSKYLKVEDFNGDGLVDIIASFSGSADNHIYWYKNNGTGIFSEHQISQNEYGYYLDFITIDLDADGDRDILAKAYNKGHLVFMENEGEDNFTSSEFETNKWDVKTYIAHDFNADGLEDLVLFHGERFGSFDGHLTFMENAGDTSFNSHVLMSDIQHESMKFEIRDMDGDTDMDIIEIGNYYTELELFNNTRINDFLHLNIAPFIDLNTNGIMDSSEYGFQTGYVSVEPAEDYQFLTDNYIELYLSTGQDFELDLNLDTNIWIGTDSLHRSLSSSNDSLYLDTTLYIGLNPVNEFLIESDIAGQWPRCGRTITHNLSFQNLGSALDSAFVHYALPDSVKFVSSVPEPVDVEGNVLKYKFNEVLSAEKRNIEVLITLPVAMDTVLFEMDVLVDTGLFVSLSNSKLEEVIRCSYDPNDKNVFPKYEEEGYVVPGEELEYLIRFQNTGNDTAFRVVVQDKLDPKLDMRSYELISNSHPVRVKQDFSAHRLEFIFEDIELTDTLTNEPESHGFVKFKIIVLDSMDIDGQVKNKAEIYFDGNSPIRTNTEKNTIYDCNQLGLDLVLDTLFYTDWNLSVISLEEEFVDFVRWEIDGVVDSTNQSKFYPHFNEAGIQPISLHLENPYCQLDTVLYVDVVEYSGDGDGSWADQIKVYPNPNTGNFNIRLSKEYKNVDIDLYNVLGQLITFTHFDEVQNTTMNLNGPAGVYFMKLRNSEGKNATIKIVKQ